MIRFNEKIIHFLIAWLGGALIALCLWEMGILETWEAKTWDWRSKILAQKGPATDDICMILVDQNSLDWGREVNEWPWPWPREVFSLVIDFCRRADAKALAMDVLFTESSGFGTYDDAVLGEAFKSYGRVAGALFIGEETGSEISWPSSIPKSGLSVTGFERWKTSLSTEYSIFTKASFPIPEVAMNAAALCNVHLAPDPDGIYRRVRPFDIFDENYILSLGLGSYLSINARGGQQSTIRNESPDMALAEHLFQIPREKRIEAQPGGFIIDDRWVPTDGSGNVILRYRGAAGTHKAYSAASVIQSELRIRSGEKPVIDPSLFRDKYLFFGYSAPGLYDLRPSPISGIYPGIEIHATMLDNFLSNDFMREIPYLWSVFTFLFFTAICAAALIFLNNLLLIMGGGAILLSLPVLFSLFLYMKGFWLSVVACEVAVLNTIFLIMAIKYATEGRQKRFIKSAFQQYISPVVIDRIIANPDLLELGGTLRTLSIFFSDLESFTSISEKLKPDDLAKFLNEYLTAMTDIIIEEGGTVDKYEGDAIIAFWNAPLDEPDHALKCVRAALRCQRELARMRPGFREKLGRDLKMRIGINTGDAVVGNFGSKIKFDYTILGDAVNLAARLEGNNKEFGTYTMVSHATRIAAGNAFMFRKLACITVVGRGEPVDVYEPMFQKEYSRRRDLFRDFDQGCNLFYKGNFEDAEKIFIALKNSDPVSEKYALRCRELIDNPPPKWDGVWVMTRK